MTSVYVWEKTHKNIFIHIIVNLYVLYIYIYIYCQNLSIETPGEESCIHFNKHSAMSVRYLGRWCRVTLFIRRPAECLWYASVCTIAVQASGRAAAKKQRVECRIWVWNLTIQSWTLRTVPGNPMWCTAKESQEEDRMFTAQIRIHGEWTQLAKLGKDI